MHVYSPSLSSNPYAAKQPHTKLTIANRYSIEIRAVFVFILVLAFYIVQVQGTISEDYSIRDAEDRIAALQDKESEYSAVISNLKTIRSFDTFAESEGFVNADAGTYLPIDQAEVVSLPGSRINTP